MVIRSFHSVIQNVQWMGTSIVICSEWHIQVYGAHIGIVCDHYLLYCPPMTTFFYFSVCYTVYVNSIIRFSLNSSWTKLSQNGGVRHFVDRALCLSNEEKFYMWGCCVVM